MRRSRARGTIVIEINPLGEIVLEGAMIGDVGEGISSQEPAQGGVEGQLLEAVLKFIGVLVDNPGDAALDGLSVGDGAGETGSPEACVFEELEVGFASVEGGVLQGHERDVEMLNDLEILSEGGDGEEALMGGINGLEDGRVPQNPDFKIKPALLEVGHRKVKRVFHLFPVGVVMLAGSVADDQGSAC